MRLLILVLVLEMGDAVFWQRLSCPYEAKQQDLLRVLCRRTSADCCSGLAFRPTSLSADGGNLRVTQDTLSFSVELLQPTTREGVYWCGLLGRNDTIIKLAESYFHHTSAAFIWSIGRWIVLPLLPIATMSTLLCSRRQPPNESPYDIIQ
ncbi:uncharacterized protein si:ch211-102c2.4 [Cyprinodon tularosa]|uniref:uncharacterized protein si:ch211-102c2.4 n=1 Tax=Cyprinodon tularosa TaxID=77115 RepID=UPI0018E20CAC|nr:uncharacterized protein si:ch211-102c2.4 [Cyprinodon tularosa]